MESTIGWKFPEGSLIGCALGGDGEVGAVGVVEDQGADAGFGVHHHAVCEVDADFFWVEELPQALLVFEVARCSSL